MLKYLKSLVSIAVFSAFVPLTHAQESKSEDKELSKEEEAIEKLLTLPSTIAPSTSSAIESNDFVRAQSAPGIDAATVSALGTSGLNTLISQTSGDAATRATQLKTLINLVDVYSNVDDSGLVGRRAIDATADLTSIISSISSTITVDHLDTLSNLDTTHMSTFASDGVSNIENFAARVDVTSAMLGTSISAIDTTNLTAVVENLHASLDGDSLTALKSLEKTHMSTLSTGIDLTTSFDASVLKKSVKKFATKAEVTVTFAKKAGGGELTGVDLSTIATSIHETLDDDHISALQNLSVTHLDAMMPETSELSSGLNVSHIAHVATKAEVVVEFAKASAGTTAVKDDGSIDFGSSFEITSFVTTVHTHITEEMTQSIALFDPEHISTLVPTGGTINQEELEHFGTKAQVGATFFTPSMSESDRKTLATTVANKVDTLDKDMTTSFKSLADHSNDISFTDIVGNISIDNIHHAGAKAKKTSTFIASGASVAELKQLADDLEADTAHLETLAAMDQTKLASTYSGVSITAATSDENKHRADAVHHSGIAPTDLGDYSAEQLKALANSTQEEKDAIKAGTKDPFEHANAGKAASEVQDAATALKGSMPQNSYTSSTGFQAALESAISVANVLLTDRVISSDSDMDNMPEIKLSSLASNGYNTELVRLLAQYGALGSNGSALADAVLGNSYSAFNASLNLGTLDQPNVSYYQQFLTDLGARALGKEITGSTVTSVPTSNIEMTTGAHITFKPNTTIDASDVLPDGKARKIAMIGSAKDMIIEGDLTITNTNKTENNVVVLGSADEIHIRSEYSSSSTTPEHFTGNPDVVNLTYTGSNAAIGSEDTMRLVNVSMSTGGNLAIGSLNELHIGTDVAQSNSISVGTGGENSDPDNVYMYANSLIQINGLNITGRVDDVYMEAITINLKNVNFPTTSEVVLRSRDGTIGFNQFSIQSLGVLILQM
jgi:hypothetical protein